MLAALLANLPSRTGGRSAGSRYWYAAPEKQIEEIVQAAVRQIPAARVLWEEIETYPDYELAFRASAQLIDLAVSQTRAEQTFRAMREAIRELEDEETVITLLH